MPFGWCCVRPEEVLDSVVAKPPFSERPPSLEMKLIGTSSSNDSSTPGSASRPGSPANSDSFKTAVSSFPFDEAMDSMKNKDATVSTPALGITASQGLSTELKVSVAGLVENKEGIELDDASTNGALLPIVEETPSAIPTPPSFSRSNQHRGPAFVTFDRDELFSPKGRHLNKTTKTTTTNPSVSPDSSSSASRTVSNPPARRCSSIHRALRPRGQRPSALGIHDVVTFTHRRRNVKGKILRKGKLGTWVVALYHQGDGTSANTTLTNETVAKRTKTLTKVVVADTPSQG